MKPPGKIFGQDTVPLTVTLVREEFDWLRSEAKRRKLKRDELLHLLMARHFGSGKPPPPQFYSKGKGKKVTMGDIVSDVIRVGRLAQSWRKDDRLA